MYYDYRSGIYYTYNQGRGAYEFYSQVSANNTTTTTQDQQTAAEEMGHQTKTGRVSKKKSRNRQASAGKDTVAEKNEANRMDLVESGSEDGEIVEVEDVDEGKMKSFCFDLNGKSPTTGNIRLQLELAVICHMVLIRFKYFSMQPFPKKFFRSTKVAI